MGRKKEMKELASIIKNFRKGELDVKLDEEHVERWLSQFSEESQDVILAETTRIFSRWYFNRDYIKNEFLDKVIDELMQRYSFQSIDDLCNNVVFISMQKIGQSQKILVDMLEKCLAKKYDVSLQKKATDGQRIFVYLDDGLYSGKRAQKELLPLIEELPEGCTLDAFFMLVYFGSFRYVEKQIKDKFENKKINLNMFFRNGLETDKYIEYTDWGYNYNTHQEHLWPSHQLRSIPEFAQYGDWVVQELQSRESKAVKYVYRSGLWENDAGIFSSVQNRNIVEREFFLQGLKIYESLSEPKGKYPLGYNTYPSFGFGSFCASDLNISNTCPLVLWWGNLEKHGDALDSWYPLLLRRTNPKADGMEPCAW